MTTLDKPRPVLTRSQKLAMLLVMMGNESAAQVMKSLPDDQLCTVTAEMARLPMIDLGQQQEILNEFGMILSQTGAVGGVSFLRSALEKAVGSAKAADLLNVIDGHKKPVPSAIPEMTGLDSKQLHAVLQREQPQTIALVISFLSPAKGAELLGLFGVEQREAVIERLALQEPAPKEVAEKLARALLQQIASRSGSNVQSAEGVRSAARVLNMMKNDTSSAIIEGVNKRRAPLGDTIRREMFMFADLVRLDPETLQEILRGIKATTLGIALQASDDQFRAAIFRGFSKRAAENILDEINLLGRAKPRQIAAAQQEILDAAHLLDAAGKISLKESLSMVAA